MDENINIEIEELFKLLDNSSLIKELKIYKNNVLNNKELMNKINKIKTLDKYDSSFLDLKLEIYKNVDYSNYITLESKLNFLIMEFNNRTKKLMEKKHESN